MKPAKLSQNQLEILNSIDELVRNGQKKLEEFEAESAAMDEKWKKIAKIKQSKQQNIFKS